MARPKPIGMKQLFGDAGQSQQLHQLRGRVEELEAEIAQLRAAALGFEEKAALEQRIEELSTQLATSGGVHEISINLIDPDQSQPRQTFPETIVQERVESLRRQGQKTPVVLIPQSNGRYTLFDGELRWRAASLLGWATLKAVLLSKDEALDEADIFEGQLVTSIHSQKLHDLDLATALLRLIVHKHPSLREQSAEIPKILNTAYRRLERERKHLELGQIRIAEQRVQSQWLETAGFKEVGEQAIFTVILGLQLNPISINNNIFPLLKLASDLKQVIKMEGLDASKAKELNRLSAEQLHLDNAAALQIRTSATQQVIREKLSVSKVKELVNDLIARYSKEPSNKPSVVAKLTKAVQDTKIEPTTQPEELKTLENALREKLAEIQLHLKNT